MVIKSITQAATAYLLSTSSDETAYSSMMVVSAVHASYHYEKNDTAGKVMARV